MSTALTYLPIVETAVDIIAQLDVLVSFATVAALSPDGYVRPVLTGLTDRTRIHTSTNASPTTPTNPHLTEASRNGTSSDVYSVGGEGKGGEGGGRKIILRKARHPCVELMDNVSFIANDYDLVESSSNFQIITGPNMVSIAFCYLIYVYC